MIDKKQLIEILCECVEDHRTCDGLGTEYFVAIGVTGDDTIILYENNDGNIGIALIKDTTGTVSSCFRGLQCDSHKDWSKTLRTKGFYLDRYGIAIDDIALIAKDIVNRLEGLEYKALSEETKAIIKFISMSM